MHEEIFWGFLVLCCLAFVVALFVWRTVLACRTRRTQQEILDELGTVRQLLQTVLRRLPPEAESPETAGDLARLAKAPVSREPVAEPARRAPSPAPVPPPVAPPVSAPTATVPPVPAPVAMVGQRQAEPAVQAAATVPTPATPGPAAATQAAPRAAGGVKPAEPPIEKATAVWLRRAWNWILVGADQWPTNVSFEYAVASNWLLRIGVVIVVVGISFFLRYCFDRNLVNPSARVVLSMLTGAAMVVAGVRLLGRQYHIFGQGLIGGGLAALYLSIFAASMLPRYRLISLEMAWPLMAVVTAAAGVLAVRHNSLLVAVLGILGGYGTPLLLRTGQANFPGLFAYMLVLGVGVLAIAHFRHWHLLNYLGFLLNYALFFGAVHEYYRREDFWLVMPFLVAFFALYSAVVCIYNLRQKQATTLLEIAGLLLNASVFFTASYRLVTDVYGSRWVAVVTLGLCLVYVGHVYAFLRLRLADRALLLTLLGLAAFFLTVSLPLALSREWLTVCWAVQAFLMLWIGGKLDSQFLRLCAYVVYIMVLWRVAFLDFGRAFRRLDGTLPPAVYWRSFVDRLVAFGVPVLSLGGAYRLLLRPGPAGPAPVCRAADIRAVLPRGPAFRLFLVLAVALGFVYLHFELNRMFLCLWEPLRLPVLSGLWIALAVGLALVLAQTPAPALNLALAAVAAGVLLKLLVVDLQYWQLDVHRLLYATPHSWVQVAMRTLDFGVIIAFLLLFPRFAGTAVEAQAMAPVFAGLALALLFLYSTLELQTYLAIFRPGFRAGAVSILWTVFALAFVVRGIARNRRALRYVGLLLFAVVVWKVFFVDLARLDPIYRIVSFIVLGILVLCGSLIYLKYRDKFVIGTGAANQETPHP